MSLQNQTYFDPVERFQEATYLIFREKLLHAATTWTALSFNSEVYDTNNIHDVSSNNSRLTVPSGITKVKLKAQIYWSATLTGYRETRIYKNGADMYMSRDSVEATDSHHINQFSSPMLDVVSGDYFEAYCYQNRGGSTDVIGSSQKSTWFAMEIIN